jgi:hypothetical protein
MPRKTSAAARPTRRRPPAAPSPAEAADTAPPPAPYARREERGAAPLLPIAGGGLATMAQVSPEPLEWLIDGLVPRNELTLIAGPSSCGKSTFLARLVAHCTTGGRWHRDDEHLPGHALIYPLEEAAGAAPLERLIAAEADLSRVAIGTRLTSGGAAQLPYLPDGMAQLAARARACRASIVVIDPLTSLLVNGFRTGDGQDVRRLLNPLQDMARELGIVILYTLHYRKSNQGDASNWVSGHKDWWNVPRHIVCMGRDPRRPDFGVMAIGKQGRGKPRRSLSYTIILRNGADYFEPGGETDTTATDLGVEPEDDLRRTARQLAAEYLRQVLATEDQRVARMLLECQGAGFSAHSLERAARDLGVQKVYRDVGGDRAWWWCRPEKWPD